MHSMSGHGLRAPYDPSRRGFLIAMLGAGVTLGFARSSLAAVQGITSGLQRAGSASELFEPTIWYSIDRGGEVTVNITRAEMGQHVGTALARIVADEPAMGRRLNRNFVQLPGRVGPPQIAPRHDIAIRNRPPVRMH